MFKKRQGKKVSVSCDEAKSLLLSRTGLRITCPEDDDEKSTQESYDDFVKKQDQKYAEKFLKKHPASTCAEAKKIVHEKLGVQYLCSDEDEKNTNEF